MTLLSWIWFMDLHLLTTRDHPSISLTFISHRLLHFTLDCLSHHPLPWVHTAVTNHMLTWKVLHPLYNTRSDSAQIAENCSAHITLLELVALRSQFQVSLVSLAIVRVLVSLVPWFLPVSFGSVIVCFLPRPTPIFGLWTGLPLKSCLLMIDPSRLCPVC